MKGENSVWASDSRWHSVWPLFSTVAVVVVTSTKTRSPLLLRSLVTPLSSPCCKKKNEKERSFLQFSLVHWMAGIGGWNKKKKKKMDNRSLKEGYKSDLGPNLSWGKIEPKSTKTGLHTSSCHSFKHSWTVPSAIFRPTSLTPWTIEQQFHPT